jgi:hypothetical protein
MSDTAGAARGEKRQMEDDGRGVQKLPKKRLTQDS